MREDKLGDFSMELSVEILQLTKELRANGIKPFALCAEIKLIFSLKCAIMEAERR